MQASFLLFTLAIGFRKMSTFINLARWFISLKDFDTLMANTNNGDIFKQINETESSHNSNITDELMDPSPHTKVINRILTVVLGFHGGLLMSLALISDKNDVLFIVNFIHYYPMAGAIILAMAYVYFKLRRFVAFEIKQSK